MNTKLLFLCAKITALALCSLQPVHAELETLARFDRSTPPGNVAVTPQGRIIMSLHQFYPTTIKVVEVFDDGSVKPFPNQAWANPPGSDGVGINMVLGLVADGRGVVWLLDNAGPGQTGKLVAWNSVADRLERVVYLAPPATVSDSFLNDLAVDLVHQGVYIADTAGQQAALIVVDLATGQAVRRLQGHPSVLSEDIPMVIEGETVTLGGKEARVAVNPITIDPANEWVYYGAMNGTALYRVRSRDLMDFELDDTELGQRVERYGDKPISDGITTDGAGNVYITDITGNAIGVTGPDGTYRIIHQGPGLLWPDGFAFGPDGYIYVTVNQLHRSATLHGGVDTAQPPFLLLRFPALAPGAVGR